MSVAVVALTAAGAATARRLAQRLTGLELHLPDELCAAGEIPLPAPLSATLPRLFSSHRALVCVMASGIVVRLLAPYFKGKERDAAVVVVDEAGQFAISLLAGHLGGANALAREVAAALGGTPVITTATDVQGLPAWDESARTGGLVVEPLVHIKALNGALLRGEPVALVDPRRRIAEQYAGLEGVRVCNTFMEADEAACRYRVLVTHRLVDDLETPVTLMLRPRDLVIGIGCNRGTGADEIAQVVHEVLHEQHLAFSSVSRLATIDEKRDEPGLVECARRWKLPLDTYPAERLNAVETPSPPSAYVLAAVGARGVCEPAALCSAEPGVLLVKKQKRGNVTVAVAEHHD